MKVLKFGGTSVGNADNIRKVINIINNNDRKIVIFSAMSGTTDMLLSAINLIKEENIKDAGVLFKNIIQMYVQTAAELIKSKEVLGGYMKFLDKALIHLNLLSKNLFKIKEENTILSYGELITVELINCYLHDLNIQVVVLPSLEIIKLNENNNPDFTFIQNKLNFYLHQNTENRLFIMQGFICLNHNEEIDNLKRGGSDYTATIVGSACKAEEVEIWSDIDGLHNNDPRHVSSTSCVDRLSYEEAEELAYFGAKVLHPTCIYPVKKNKIPVFLKNTMNPTANGTHIYDFEKSDGIKAIAAKDGIVAIKIQSGRMLQAYGFLKKIFEVFELYKTPVDMITTSEVSVSVTIDNPSCLNLIVKELLELGSVDVFPEQSIVCVVGNFKSEEKGIVSEVLKSIDHIPVRMLSYGASENNLTLLVKENDKKEVLCSLHKKLFKNQFVSELI